jgi:hypothetical protein
LWILVEARFSSNSAHLSVNDVSHPERIVLLVDNGRFHFRRHEMQLHRLRGEFFDDDPIARLRFDVAPLGTRASWQNVKIWGMKAGGLGDG